MKKKAEYFKLLSSSENYFDYFPDNKESRELRLKYAFDARKMELDLYWRRTTFYWVLVGLTIAGYWQVLSSSFDSSDKQPPIKSSTRIDETANTSKRVPQSQPAYPLILMSVSGLGIIFSSGWYLTNRSSGYWHANWDEHVHLHEGSVIGNLFYMKVDSDQFKKWPPLDPYPFSSTKIQTTISLATSIAWLIIFVNHVIEHFSKNGGLPTPVLAILIISGVAWTLCCMLNSDRTKEKDRTRYFEIRDTKIENFNLPTGESATQPELTAGVEESSEKKREKSN